MNVGDLKLLIQGLPDDEPVYIFTNGTVYDVNGMVGAVACVEHNGKKHKKKGLILEMD